MEPKNQYRQEVELLFWSFRKKQLQFKRRRKSMEQNQNMGVNREDTYTIDVEHLASSIEATMSQSDLSMSAKRCIFKTPVALTRHNKRAYIPDAFSIGPIHHGRKNLKATETIKAKYLQDLISRSQPFFPNTILLKDFINSINALETDARECYAEPIVCSREEFVKTLVIDGCFIIELLCRFCYEDLREKNNPIFSISSMIEVLWHDLILLENQVPWMVLERLFSMSMAPQCSGITLLQLAIAPINVIFLFPLPVGADLDRKHIKHIPDLLKKLLVSSIEVDEESGSQSDGADLDCQHIIHIPGLLKKLLVSSIEVDEESRSQSANPWILHSATRLKEAGIKFRKSKSKNMFDIKFTKGVLEIPPISIHDKSETIFRNLISFEQCCPDSDDRITSYAKLLNNLISTTKDVEILCENQILNIWLNPKDAVQFFKKLYHDACIQEFYYADLYEQVNKYCQRRWPRYRVVLVHNYFNTPWAILSTSAAVMLLIFTFLQTLYTMKS